MAVWMKRALIVGLIAGAGLGLVACSGADGARDPESTVPSGDNGELTDPVGARDALTAETCVVGESGAWSGAGTLTNDTDAEATYLVRFSVVDTATSAVLGTGEATETLAPGKSTEVALADFFTPEDPEAVVSCHVRVVSGD